MAVGNVKERKGYSLCGEWRKEKNKVAIWK